MMNIICACYENATPFYVGIKIQDHLLNKKTKAQIKHIKIS